LYRCNPPKDCLSWAGHFQGSTGRPKLEGVLPRTIDPLGLLTTLRSPGPRQPGTYELGHEHRGQATTGREHSSPPNGPLRALTPFQSPRSYSHCRARKGKGQPQRRIPQCSRTLRCKSIRVRGMVFQAPSRQTDPPTSMYLQHDCSREPSLLTEVMCVGKVAGPVYTKAKLSIHHIPL
jgi:hypothetical protein